MQRRLYLGAALIAALLLSTVGRALALAGSVSFENTTDKYVWITVYTSHALKATWHIAKAGCLPPKGGWKADLYEPSDYDVKVRAEVKSGDCRSGNISDTYDTRTDQTYPRLTADVYYYKNKYFIAYR
jgi:hypothetical protein